MMQSYTGITKVLRLLSKRFSNPGAMELGDPFLTTVAVILSARTRDEQVLKLLPAFFKAFPNPAALAKGTQAQVESKLSTIGMYKQKAKNIRAMAAMLVKEFDGKVPQTMDELIQLPGVGRKTASVVLVVCFGQPAIAVDTHVFRVTNRLGWVKTKTPEKTEEALLKIVPVDVQIPVNRVFVKLGRYICLPGKPRCWDCPVKDLCAFNKKNLLPPKDAKDIVLDIERREKELEKLREAVIS